MSQQDMCPICTEAFKFGEVVTTYTTWGKDGPGLDRYGHYDCVNYLSRIEKDRGHPPAATA